MPYAIIAILGIFGSGLGYLKGRYDVFSGKLTAPKTAFQSVFSSPFMLTLTVVLGFVGLGYFKNIRAALKGALK